MLHSNPCRKGCSHRLQRKGPSVQKGEFDKGRRKTDTWVKGVTLNSNIYIDISQSPIMAHTNQTNARQFSEELTRIVSYRWSLDPCDPDLPMFSWVNDFLPVLCFSPCPCLPSGSSSSQCRNTILINFIVCLHYLIYAITIFDNTTWLLNTKCFRKLTGKLYHFLNGLYDLKYWYFIWTVTDE